jgi:hypothetical protein
MCVLELVEMMISPVALACDHGGIAGPKGRACVIEVCLVPWFNDGLGDGASAACCDVQRCADNFGTLGLDPRGNCCGYQCAHSCVDVPPMSGSLCR